MPTQVCVRWGRTFTLPTGSLPSGALRAPSEPLLLLPVPTSMSQALPTTPLPAARGGGHFPPQPTAHPPQPRSPLHPTHPLPALFSSRLKLLVSNSALAGDATARHSAGVGLTERHFGSGSGNNRRSGGAGTPRGHRAPTSLADSVRNKPEILRRLRIHYADCILSGEKRG